MTVLHGRGPPLHSVHDGFATEGAPLGTPFLQFCTGRGAPLGTLFVTVLHRKGDPHGTPFVTVLLGKGPLLALRSLRFCNRNVELGAQRNTHCFKSQDGIFDFNHQRQVLPELPVRSEVGAVG